jgi:hypothetical protein
LQFLARRLIVLVVVRSLVLVVVRSLVLVVVLVLGGLPSNMLQELPLFEDEHEDEEEYECQ